MCLSPLTPLEPETGALLEEGALAPGNWGGQSQWLRLVACLETLRMPQKTKESGRTAQRSDYPLYSVRARTLLGQKSLSQCGERRLCRYQSDARVLIRSCSVISISIVADSSAPCGISSL